MSNKTPLLSICIPTYNNPAKFERLMRSLAPQVTGDVEIIIRDDSDNDDTALIVKQLQKELFKHHLLDYNHGKKEGLDVAIHFLTGHAHGKYIWWIGDDDVSSDAVERICDTLRTNKDITLLCIDAIERETGIITLQLGESRYFTDRNEVLEKVVDLLGFISITIFAREHAITGLQAANEYKGTAWVNLFIIMHVLSQDGRYYYLNQPCIVSDSRDHSKPVWYDGFKVFALNFYHVLNEFKYAFDYRSFKHALSDNLKGIWHGIFVYRAKGYMHGLGSHEPKIRPLIKYYWNYVEFWKGLPFLMIPRPIAKLLYKIYRPTSSSQIS